MDSAVIRRQIIYLLTLAVIVISSLIFLSVSQDPIIEYLTRFFKTVNQDEIESTQMSDLAAELLKNFFRIARIILWFVLIVAIIRFLNSVIFGRALRNTSSYELTTLIRNVVVILLYIIAFFIIFQSQYPDVALAPLFTGSTILGIVVGLALQDTLGNLFAGLALQADQPFQIGDVISIGNK
jgi:small-conductance mechanosensitive channel